MLEESGPRRVVPRWRASWVVAQTPEGRASKAGKAPDFTTALERSRSEFLSNADSIPIAAELMFIADRAGNMNLAREAAQKILAAKDSIGASSLIRSASRIVGEQSADRADSLANQFIREARRLLNRRFDNPVLLMDTAWAMTASGRAEAAERFVVAALSLAPQNRFVLRSAVRYFLHRGQKDRAHAILLRSETLAGDPWVQASEIAVATVLGKSSKLLKRLNRALEASDTLAENQSELGSAVATVHLNDGNDKRAKKLFAKTLLNPNDNVVAQAEWVSRRLSLVVPETALKTKYSFEANSAHRYRSLDIGGAIEQADFWRADEPFASRPVAWLGHLHAINDDFHHASEFYQQAIELEDEPDIAGLLNQNFSRIETGALEIASHQLIQLSKDPEAPHHRAQILANAGALAYASGGHSVGRDLYERAAVAAKLNNDLRTEALVRAFAARAAIKYGDPQSTEVLAAASTFAHLSLSPSATHVARRLVDEETRRRLEASAEKRVARQQLQWDPVTNVLRLIS